MKRKIILTIAVSLLAVNLFPMTVSAYTESEIRLMLGIPTLQDVNIATAESQILNDLFNTPIGDVTVVTTAQKGVEPVQTENTVFDAVFYADKYPDLKAVMGTDANLLYQHFLTAGMAEGRQGSANFNVNVYRDKNPDLQKAFQNDLTAYYNHFINSGYKENRVSH